MKNKKGNSIAINIFHLFYSTALSSILNAGALIMLAYYLQSYHYGLFSVVLAFATIMGYFTDAGLSDIVLREGSAKGVDLPKVITSYVKMRLLLLLLTFAIGFLLIEILHSSNTELIKTAYFLVFPMVTGIALQSIGITFFQLKEKMQYCGLIRIFSAACLVSSVFLGLIVELSPLVVTLLYGCSYLAAGVLAFVLLSRHVAFVWKARFHKGLYKHWGAFTLGGLLFVLLPHLGPLVLERTLTLEEVGMFAVAYRIPQALQQVTFIVAGAYYPVLFRYFNSGNFLEHLRLLLLQTKLMALIGMGLSLPFYYLSELIVPILFGDAWLGAILPLKILSVLLMLQGVNIALADGLTTMGRQRHRTAVQFVAVLSGVFLYLFTSLQYGIIGAAFAGIVMELFALIDFDSFIQQKDSC